MIYVFSVYVVASALIIAYLVWAILEVQGRGREDVDKLERRLLMLTRPEALSADVLDDEAPKEVSYMTDERMAELERQHR